MRIHFIAIGGAIMHQLAITLSKKGHQVSGSDDVINDPAKSNLEKEGILPTKIGFFAENITSDIEVVVLGMHAKFDNIELTRAMELGIKVYSFPEYIYEQSKEKTRVVVAGSHGKTTITSMIMHALRHQNMDFDYLVGSSVKGFEHSVKISDAPIIILEGDEYLASSLTKEPKFIYYKGNLACLSGIEWDHVNVFKTEAIYFEQFQKLVKSLESGATLFYYNTPKIAETIQGLRSDISLIPYQSSEYTADEDKFILKKDDVAYSFDFFGKHNMENLEAAKNICISLGMKESEFYCIYKSMAKHTYKTLEFYEQCYKTLEDMQSHITMGGEGSLSMEIKVNGKDYKMIFSDNDQIELAILMFKQNLEQTMVIGKTYAALKGDE